MQEQVLITIKDAKAHKFLKSLEDVKFIKIVNDPMLDFPQKRKNRQKIF